MRGLILVLGLLVGSILTWWLRPVTEAGSTLATARDESSEDVDSAAPGRVVLSSEQMTLAGIEAVVMTTQTVHPEHAFYGEVVDAVELLRQMRALEAARGVAAAQGGTLGALQQRLQRLKEFAARGEVAATRELAELEIAVLREHERSRELAARASDQRDQAAVSWGSALLAALAGDQQTLTAFDQGSACLVRFAAPAVEIDLGRSAVAAADGVHAHAVTARLLAPAPAVTAGFAGATWYAGLPCAGLRVGMPVAIWVSAQGAAITGAVLPASAVLWHAGSRWYYVEEGAGIFTRHALGAAVAHGEDVVLVDQGALEAKVVVRGAQTVLAEEQRAAIPEEDDD